MEWTPQRWVWWGLLAAAVANLGCLAVVVATSRRRGWQRAPQPPAFWSGGEERARGPLRSLAIVVAVGLFAFAVASPAAAACAAVATAAAAWWRGARRLVRILPALFVGAAGSYTAVQQWRYDYPAGFEWPTYFSRVHPIAWMAIAILVGVVLIDRGARHQGANEDR